MFKNSIEDLSTYYSAESENRAIQHKRIFEEFTQNATNDDRLRDQFYNCEGFGELAFSWNWYLLVNAMNSNFSFLEIGIYKGRILALIQMLADMTNKHVNIYGISPLDMSNDKYSTYADVDYISEIKKNYTLSKVEFDNTKLIKGYSQNVDVIKEATNYAPFDIVFIDGCHDYEVVCMDIDNYLPLIKSGGYLVMDDAASLLEGAYGNFVGHLDVGKAIQDKLDNNPNFRHLYAVGHNRVWQKL